MTTELTKAAQQALVSLADELASFVGADNTQGRFDIVERALTQRPAAQEVARFEAGCNVLEYLKQEGAPYRITSQMLIALHGDPEGRPAPQQATPATSEDMKVYGGIAAGYFADTQQATPTRATREAEQRARMQARLATRHEGKATADFDLPPPNDAPQQATPEWLHLKSYGYAPGNYMSKCLRCDQITPDLDKRATSCRPCAEAAHALQQATPEPVGEPPEGEFFAWDAGGGIAFYKTQQEAIDHAKESLNYYLDGAIAHGEWDEDVEQIRWGVVMQRAKATNISVTEDGENSCDYELQDVATRPTPVETEPVGERWVVVRETSLDVGEGNDVRTGGRPELGYALISDAATFGSEDAAVAAIKSASLPVGWVVLPLSRLLPDLGNTRPAPGVPEGFALVPMTEDQVWHNDSIMSANAIGGLKMDAVMRIVRGVEAHHSERLAAAQAKGGQA